MTLLDLISFLRINILDDTGGHGVDWGSYSENEDGSFQLRWGNEELTANINEAIKQVYKRINPIVDIYTIPIQTGVSEYSLHSYVRRIIMARRSDGAVLEEKSILDYVNNYAFDTQVGKITQYIPDQETNKIRVYPTPIENDTLICNVYRYPKVSLTWDRPSDAPELREEFLIPMLNYAAFLCYMKDEANTYDPNRAATFSALFDREFPFTSSYSSVRKARTANRPVRFRW